MRRSAPKRWDSANVFNDSQLLHFADTEMPHFARSRRSAAPIWRLLHVARWAGCAAVAVAAVAFLSQTEGGSERLERAFAGATETAPVSVQPAVAEPSAAQAKAETERLTARVRDLTADRDRLNARLASLERQLADVTGSIAHPATAPVPVSAPAPEPIAAPAIEGAASAAPAAIQAKPAVLMPAMPRQIAAIARPSREPPRIIEPLAMPVTRDIAAHWSDASHPAPTEDAAASAVPLPPMRPTHVRPIRVAAVTVRKRTPPPQPSLPELGLDVGGSLSPGHLRSQWTEVKANFGPLLAGLHPVIGRDGRFGHLPYRLLIGPVPNDETAARLCANLIAGGVECHPTPFAGQQLAQY
jgi:hypothetical protein